MRVRNVGETHGLPTWGELLAATTAHRSNKGSRSVSLTAVVPSRGTSAGRCPLSSLPLTILVAALSSAPALAQTPNAPAVPAQATPLPTIAPPPSPATLPRGRVRVFVRDAISKEFLSDAAIFFDDPTLTDLRSVPYYVGDSTRRDESNRPLGGPGFVISDPLTTHRWVVVVLKDGYETGRAVVDVLPDRITQVTVYLRFRERIEPFTLLSTRETTNTVRRSQQFVREIPVAVSSRQEINDVLASAPGFVRNSLNQVHPRGQRFGIATYLDGFLLPSLPAGELQGFLPQEMIARYDIRTGGLSAEYGGDVGVAVDLTTRSAGATPTIEGLLTTGDYNGAEAYITVGQRFPLGGRFAAAAARQQAVLDRAKPRKSVIGGAFVAPGAETVTKPGVGYLLHVSQRNTSAIAEAAQKKATLNNAGYNNSLFGKFELVPSPKLQIEGLININGARSGIANRDRAGGVGYLGYVENTGAFQQSPATLPSQDEEYQSQHQKENNNLALITLRRTLRPKDIVTNPDSTVTLTIGSMDNQVRLENTNRNFDPRDLTNPNSPLYRRNSSVEYNPTVRRDYSQIQIQADVVAARRNHIIKGGVLYNSYQLNERYRFEPGSQVALDALYARSPSLLPPSVTADPSGIRDGFGNRVVAYQTGLPAESPSLRIRRDGTYSALYIQDTWSFNQALTLNSGIRYDGFSLNRVSGNAATGVAGSPSSDRGEISPRLNFALQLPRRGPLGFLGGVGTRRAVLRASYDRLFQRPPLSQGTYFGASAIRPQTGDSYELGLEKQLGANQVVKGTFYTIQFQNYLDVEGLFPGAQFSTGALVLVNYPRAISEGIEISYNYNPTFRNGNPLTAFATYTNGGVKFQNLGYTFDSLGRQVQRRRPDLDQEQTLNFGASYRLRASYMVGLSAYLGSGLYGSRLPNSNSRQGIAEVNLHLASSPRFFRRLFGLDISVENAFDQRNRYNSYNAYEASRVQIGRRLLTSVYTRF